ncbi:autophagy-related protein 11-like isoform X2 [Salvia miltiorrhiza]|nr:autophagy-related protein 11-like isoform X2 [Salvia miltiorrhiza]XP_057767187.1 autophagy-related protein 11-like isoform X2 [Salvia miltiorrhiza]XP_057767188.1 autophagy-related protein 11-like isoform X2 [Salvia miltiorrhiza]XP_057767189.1 autophagy-related protein 11-like isoform X2 [Salvia miltiorrhiza]XP_057767190.1 autophagy-related protein 11-like isoform X2 [Salvia miltiorrhiza]XP_057767191.1 autophagy-related protein 11-like isoform X2 [Salvia miltiorrhiza]
MSSSVSEAVVQTGKLVVHVAESGQSYKIECDECTLVEAVQSFLESACGIAFSDQLLLCLDSKLEPHRTLSVYKLPSDEREVFLFNKARMRSNSPYPEPVQVEIIDIPDPPLPSPSQSPLAVDDASDPALKALPSYERQFRYHFHCGHAIYSRTSARFETCERLLEELKVQEKALEIARGNLDHFYKMIHQNYVDFMKCYSQQHRSHANLLATFARDKEKLRSIRLLPALQTANRKCLLDFVKEENLQKTWEDCSSLHKQFQNKVSEFKLEFGELKNNAEHLFSDKASFLIKDLESSIRDRQQIVNEQKSIMQALSKDVNTVKKLVDDCLSGQMSSSLRPHDAVSALGPMYDSHDKNFLPRMKACEGEISSLLDFCTDKKNEMNIFVHSFMQKIAYIQHKIKDVRYKFSVFHEALKRQDDQFEQLKVVRGITPAYRACLAEVVRRKAAMKIYMGKAGQLAEKLATERNTEVRRREEFLRVHTSFIPRDILASMGLYDTPNPCDVNVAPFDSNLLDIDLVDLEFYAPESMLGLLSKTEKHGTLKSSLSMSDDGYRAAAAEGVTGYLEKYDYGEVLEESELVEIAGTSKMEVENAKLKAELASKIALICSMSAELDYESLDECKQDSLLKNAAQKTSEALSLKDEYEKHLQSMLKVKQKQCESYKKRIQELEQRLSDQCMRGADGPNLMVSTTKTDDNKSEVSGVESVHMHRGMEEVLCASSTSKSGILTEHDKSQEGLDDNMTDSSSMLNSHLDSSMLDLHRDKGHLCYKDKMATPQSDAGTSISSSNMAVSMSQLITSDLDGKGNGGLLGELQNALSEKSSQLDDAEAKIRSLTDEISRLGRDLDASQKLLDESQMNCAHLENCLHEAREEAQTHLSAVDRRASEYNALRATAVKMCGLFERLRSCVSSVEVAAFADTLHALSQSLSRSSSEAGEDSASEFRECIQMLADKVGLLSRQRAEFLERSTEAEAANKQLNKELHEKKELVNTLYLKHHMEKQANKEKICLGRLEVHELAAFVLNSSGHYEAINRSCPNYYLSAESVALFTENVSRNQSYILGQVVHIEQRVVKPPPPTLTLDEAVDNSESGGNQSTLDQGSLPNPYGLPVGCEYFVVTVAMLPDTVIRSPLS